MLAAIRDRGTNQTQLCASLAPANFSLWKNDKHFRVKELYSAALERRLENPQLELDDPGLTGTVPHQVPPRNTMRSARGRSASASPPPPARRRRRRGSRRAARRPRAPPPTPPTSRGRSVAASTSTPRSG